MLRPETFGRVRKFIYSTAGIDIPETKREMVAGRLAKQARLHGFETIEAYFSAAERGEASSDGHDLVTSLIDCLTTNFTSFFREPAHFDFLRQVILPQLSGRGAYRIWSAASSTGEEPYSIAMTLLEELGPQAGQRACVLATDISTRVLAAAAHGVYPAERFRAFPEDWRRRYLLRGKGEQAGNYQIRPAIRSLVEFRRLNLLEQTPPEGPFPLVFLRNVMIYFDRPTMERVVAQIRSKIEPGGYLFIGHSESLNGIAHGLKPVQVAIYRQPGGRA
jgi:chemotaxis protein methyltransferase CheR